MFVPLFKGERFDLPSERNVCKIWGLANQLLMEVSKQVLFLQHPCYFFLFFTYYCNNAYLQCSGYTKTKWLKPVLFRRTAFYFFFSQRSTVKDHTDYRIHFPKFFQRNCNATHNNHQKTRMFASFPPNFKKSFFQQKWLDFWKVSVE